MSWKSRFLGTGLTWMRSCVDYLMSNKQSQQWDCFELTVSSVFYPHTSRKLTSLRTPHFLSNLNEAGKCHISYTLRYIHTHSQHSFVDTSYKTRPRAWTSAVWAPSPLWEKKVGLQLGLGTPTNDSLPQEGACTLHKSVSWGNGPGSPWGSQFLYGTVFLFLHRKGV